MRKRSNVEQQTIELEASNTPRFDIDGQRYGNTLTDDMIYLKNPRTKRGIDRHAPTSLPYFTRSDYDRNFALDNAEKYSHSISPTLSNNVNPMFNAPTLGEQKSSNNPIYHTYGMEGNISGRTKHSEGEQWLREDAEYDPAVDTLVNYNRLSPAQMELLIKMGVNRPESEDLMNNLHLYQYYMDNLRK